MPRDPHYCPLFQAIENAEQADRPASPAMGETEPGQRSPVSVAARPPLDLSRPIFVAWGRSSRWGMVWLDLGWHNSEQDAWDDLVRRRITGPHRDSWWRGGMVLERGRDPAAMCINSALVNGCSFMELAK